MKIIMLINVKMPATVGILTIISRIETTLSALSRNIFSAFYCLCAVEISCLDVVSMKKSFLTSGIDIGNLFNCYNTNAEVIYTCTSIYIDQPQAVLAGVVSIL